MFHKNSLPIFDGHNDSIPRFFYKHSGRKSFFDLHAVGHIDFPRIQQANLIGGFFAIFIPSNESIPKNTSSKEYEYKFPLAPAISGEYAYSQTCQIIDFLEEILENDHVFLIKTKQDIRKCYEEESLGMVLHFEGAEAICDFDKLEKFYARGLRSLGIVWSRPNEYGVGVPFVHPHKPDIGPGLTSKGKDLVRKCNELGIVVDLSHLNEQGFWDAVAISQKPLVVSHSAVHAICPASRNLLDSQIKVVADSGGIIGINFGVLFIRQDGKINTDTKLEEIVKHFEYIVEKVGIDHVAFGSDLDGADISNDLKDVTGLPKIIDLLKEKGYAEKDLHKIAYENWFRVLRETLTK